MAPLSRPELMDQSVEALLDRVEGDCGILESIVAAIQTMRRELPSELPEVIDSAEVERLDSKVREVESALRLVAVKAAMDPVNEFREHLHNADIPKAAASWQEILDLLHGISHRVLQFTYR